MNNSERYFMFNSWDSVKISNTPFLGWHPEGVFIYIAKFNKWSTYKSTPNTIHTSLQIVDESEVPGEFKAKLLLLL